MTETIQTLKEDIAILQEKLRKLEEQDPEMLLLRQGKVDVVDYDGKKYFRIEYTDSFAGEYSWYVRRVGEDAVRSVRDVNVYAPLEELYQKEVVKQKDDYPFNPHKKYTPEETAQSLEETAQSLKEAFVKAQQTEEWKETQRKIDAPKESWMDKPVEELVAILKKNPPDCLKFVMGKTLEQIIERWWCDTFTGPHEKWSVEECIDDLIDQIELFLPRSQSSEGTQSVYTEVAVEAHNELLQKIKSKLRNKK